MLQLVQQTQLPPSPTIALSSSAAGAASAGFQPTIAGLYQGQGGNSVFTPGYPSAAGGGGGGGGIGLAGVSTSPSTSPPVFPGADVPGGPRSSPPNLHIIREDSLDSTEMCQSGEGGEVYEDDGAGWAREKNSYTAAAMFVSDNDGGATGGRQSATDRTDFEKFRRKFSNKTPRISITDVQGHVLPMTSSQGAEVNEELMIVGGSRAVGGSSGGGGVCVSVGRYVGGYCPSVPGPGGSTKLSGGVDLISSYQSLMYQVDRSSEVLGNTLPFSNFLSSTACAANPSGLCEEGVLIGDVALGNSVGPLIDSAAQLQYTAVTERPFHHLVNDVIRALGVFSDDQIFRCPGDAGQFIVQTDSVALAIELLDGGAERALCFRQLMGDCGLFRQICSQLFGFLAL